MATVRLNVVKNVYCRWQGTRQINKELRFLVAQSTSCASVVEFDKLNIPTPSIIKAVLCLTYDTTSYDDENVFACIPRWKINLDTFNFDPNIDLDKTTETSTENGGSGAVRRLPLSGDFLSGLSNNVYVYTKGWRSKDTVMYGINDATRKPYIEVIHDPCPTTYKPVCTMDNFYSVSGYYNWKCAEEVYGGIISHYDVELINQTTGEIKTLRTTSKRVSSSDASKTDKIKMRIMATTIYGVTSDWYETFVTYDNTVRVATGISPKDAFIRGDEAKSVRFEWSSSYQSSYELYLSTNGVNYARIKSEITSNKYCTMDMSGYEQGKYYWKIKCRDNNYYISSPLVFTIVKQPTITNLTALSEYYEKPIAINWRSEYQTGYEYELYYNNNMISNGTGGAEKEIIIPADTFLGTLPTSIRVRTNNVVNGVAIYSDWVERSLYLKQVQPTLKTVSLSGSNIDLPLSVTWDSTDQQTYVLEIWKNDVKIQEHSGTTQKSYSIPNNTLTTGLVTVKVKVAYKDRWTDFTQTTATLVETLPSIGVLEPDGIITDRDSQTRIWWTSQNQSRWQLIIDGVITRTGTTEKEVIIPEGDFTTGVHNMVLSVWYRTSLGVEKAPVIKKAEWIVQGRPPLPTILGNGIYETSRPIIEWDTQDQQGYILEVLKDGNVIYSTEWKNGLITQHKINVYLANGNYIARVKVMNQYSLESDYSSKEIFVNTNKPQAPILEATFENNTAILKWHAESEYTHYYIIRNEEVIGKTIEMEYIDYNCWGPCTYTIRGITSTDVYNDSDRVIVDCVVTDGIMCTVDTLDDVITVGLSQKQYAFSGDIEFDATEIFLSGRELPVAIFGEHRTGSYSIDFTSKELFRFLEMCKRRTVFMYRDKRQKLFLTIKAPSYEFDVLGTTYSVTATEVSYNEVIDYD